VFLKIHISDELFQEDFLDEDDPKKNQKKKKSKEEKEVEKRLKEAEAEYDKEERKKNVIFIFTDFLKATEMLRNIYLTYFRILKSFEASQKHTHLLAPVLKGIPKFSNYINIDLVTEALQMLKILVAGFKVTATGDKPILSAELRLFIVAGILDIVRKQGTCFPLFSHNF
jgi:hypothetical protein